MGGGPGEERVSVEAGEERMGGGPGEERVSVEAGEERMGGGPGEERVSVEAGEERMGGGPGEERVSVEAGNARLILAIETSCDDTCAAVLDAGAGGGRCARTRSPPRACTTALAAWCRRSPRAITSSW